MNRYSITFSGRLAGALGVTYKITHEVEATNEREAVLKLYDKFEHIAFPKVSLIREVIL